MLLFPEGGLLQSASDSLINTLGVRLETPVVRKMDFPKMSNTVMRRTVSSIVVVGALFCLFLCSVF